MKRKIIFKKDGVIKSEGELDVRQGEYIVDGDIGSSGESVPSDWSVNDPDAPGYIKGRTHYKENTVVVKSLGDGDTYCGKIPFPTSEAELQDYIGSVATREYWITHESPSDVAPITFSPDQLARAVLDDELIVAVGENVVVDFDGYIDCIIKVKVEITGITGNWGEEFLTNVEVTCEVVPIMLIPKYYWSNINNYVVEGDIKYFINTTNEEYQEMLSTALPDVDWDNTGIFELTKSQLDTLMPYLEEFIEEHRYHIGNSEMGYAVSWIAIQRSASPDQGFTFYLYNPSDTYKSFFTITGKTDWSYLESNDHLLELYYKKEDDMSSIDFFYKLDDGTYLGMTHCCLDSNSPCVSNIYSGLTGEDESNLDSKSYNSQYGDIGVTDLGSLSEDVAIYHTIDPNYLPSMVLTLSDMPNIENATKEEFISGLGITEEQFDKLWQCKYSFVQMRYYDQGQKVYSLIPYQGISIKEDGYIGRFVLELPDINSQYGWRLTATYSNSSYIYSFVYKQPLG